MLHYGTWLQNVTTNKIGGGFFSNGAMQGCNVNLDVNISSDNVDGLGVESTSQRR